jgi:hypothetical protein
VVDSPRPKITRALTARSHSALQRRLANRDLVIYSSYRFGCSIRLIAAAFKMDVAEVRHVIDRFELAAENPPPEDFPKSVRAESFDRSQPAE